MSAHMPIQSERLAPGRAAGEDWARIDPSVLAAEGRRLQARAMVEALATGWRLPLGCRRPRGRGPATAGTARQALRAEPGGPAPLPAGRSAARRHRPAPRRHRARGRRPASRSADAAPSGDGGATARGQARAVAGRPGQQQPTGPATTHSRPGRLTAAELAGSLAREGSIGSVATQVDQPVDQGDEDPAAHDVTERDRNQVG